MRYSQASDRTKSSLERHAIHHRRSRDRRDEGQVSILVVLAVCLFLMLFVGFGVDMTNLFFHRQMAQAAADSACVAAGMDLLNELVQGGPSTPLAKACADSSGTTYQCGGKNFTPGASAIDCTGKSTIGNMAASSGNVAPCVYAAMNGYSSPGLTAGTESNDVQVSFPTLVPGAVTPQATVAGAYPFVQVSVTDRVKVYFSSLVSGTRTQDIRAIAKCGLQQAQAPVPLLVLDPTDPETYDEKGTPGVQIVGGPIKSIQVNSDNAAAVNIQGAATTNLTEGGPGDAGSSFGVTGGPIPVPGGFSTNPPASYQPGTAPVPDPFAKVPAPPDPGAPAAAPNTVTLSAPMNHCTTNSNPCAVLGPGAAATAAGCAGPLGCDGCPDPAGCVEYGPGDWSTIDCKNETCLFAPGVYYVSTAFNLDSNSIVRPTDVTESPGDSSMGTLFFMTCSTPGACQKKGDAVVSVWANSGTKGPSVCPTAAGTFQCYDTSKAACPGVGGGLPTGGVPPIPAYVGQNVIVGPCTAAVPTSPPNYSGAYDVPGATTGPVRGMIFYTDRSGAGSDDFGGGGGLLMVGTLYVHNCPASPVCQQPPTDYQSQLALGGNSGAGTDVVGYIVADTLYLHGTSTISMFLKPSSFQDILKVAMLQ